MALAREGVPLALPPAEGPWLSSPPPPVRGPPFPWRGDGWRKLPDQKALGRLPGGGLGDEVDEEEVSVGRLLGLWSPERWVPIGSVATRLLFLIDDKGLSTGWRL